MKKILTLAFILLPLNVRGSTTPVAISDILVMFTSVFEDWVALGLGVALIVFVWGLVKMIIEVNRGGSDTSIEEGKKRMIWGVVALFVIVSIWGIYALFVEVFGISSVVNQKPIEVTL
jgi:Type IV secretion system pilin